MKKQNVLNRGIPVSVSLEQVPETVGIQRRRFRSKRRMLYISALAVVIAMLASVIAKGLIYIIDLFTNLAFYGDFSFAPAGPAHNQLGYWVIAVPVAGGIVVGLMALYGSKAIRGHGIPEAMEQVLTNQSRIPPVITFLKPLSSAISIGTGGPFGAEGPIIATGGALGSSIGQVLHISPRERKTLLAAGATAGMAAIFGTPVAAIFLAIELLLFEFSPRSLLPVALACITGAAGHHLLFESGPVFPLHDAVEIPSNTAIFFYSLSGLLIGLVAVTITRLLYLIEDLFEKSPVHWMWWPAIGGLVVGVVGYFEPRTLGVGYENITDVLNNSLPLRVVVTLCGLKFLSWIIALGSGTSGGTLAPLLTIGGGIGVVIGHAVSIYFPGAGVTPELSALVGMSAIFAGASRAMITSIIFAIEATHQSNALLPLLASCAGSYIVSFIFMENTIMTEKIARRGVRTPDSYEPELLDRTAVVACMKTEVTIFTEHTTIGEARGRIGATGESFEFFIIHDEAGNYTGIGRFADLMSFRLSETQTVVEVRSSARPPISASSKLRKAIEIMAEEDMEALAVVDLQNHVTGLITYHEIIRTYRTSVEQNEKRGKHLAGWRPGMSRKRGRK